MFQCFNSPTQGSGGVVSYGILASSDPSGHFAVDTRGTVRLARPLDREAGQRHALRLLAWDSGKPQHTAEASVMVSSRELMII